MSKRRLVNRCLMGAMLAVPSMLLGIFSLSHAQEPPAGPSLYQEGPPLRIAPADPQPAAANAGLAAHRCARRNGTRSQCEEARIRRRGE